MKSGIYKITNLNNGKIYIGSAVNFQRRFRCHLSNLRSKNHRNDKLQKSYNKHGDECFEFKVLLECDIENLIMYEQIFIDYFDAVKNGYNLNPIAGSCLNRKHSEESKAKMRASWAARKGIPKKNVSDETKRKISESKIGKKRKPFTDKTIKNMSLSKIGNKNRLGIPHTQEAKNKMKGRVPVKLSPEILEKIRLKHVGAKRSDEAKANMRAGWERKRISKQNKESNK